jgi:hypothetical protein
MSPEEDNASRHAVVSIDVAELLALTLGGGLTRIVFVRGMKVGRVGPAVASIRCGHRSPVVPPVGTEPFSRWKDGECTGWS